jgi:hypothetical protein
MNKKSVVFTTTAVSLGLATVLTLSAVAPSMAATSHKNTKSVSSTAKSAKTGASFSVTQDARKFTTVNFKISNVPSTITDAATAAKLLVVKVVPLATDATSAPATAPVPTFGGSGDARTGAPAFGNGHAPDNDGDGPGANGAGGWTPSGSATTTSTRTAPTFGNGQGGDNDGDGPAAGFGGPRGGHGHGGHGFGGPRGMQFSNLTLANGVLSGTIQIPGDEVANVQKWGVYLSIAADSANGIAAQSATPVMVTVTTAADLTATVTATSGDIALALK